MFNLVLIVVGFVRCFGLLWLFIVMTVFSVVCLIVLVCYDVIYRCFGEEIGLY